MSLRMQSPRKELLARLLEAHERSVSYGRPSPRARDIILKLDARSFPEAFAPDGRERRASLLASARDLGAGGCFRVVCHSRGPLAGEPKEIRLGPDAVPRAYEAAEQLGFEPLSTGLEEIERLAIKLQSSTGVTWMQEFLERLAKGARSADLSLLGMKRQRFKREWRDLVPALTASIALARGIAPAWERVVSERLFNDSKLLGRVRTHVVAILVRADPRWDGVPPEEAADLLEAYGLRRKPGLIRCAGAATVRVRSSIYRLEDFEPVAHLPDSWGDAWVQGIVEASPSIITTVENEYPFLAYVEDADGPACLGQRGELVVYTAGFPTPGLVGSLARLSARLPMASFRHWGDADVGGIRIWWFLRSRLGRPVELFRTTALWVAAEAVRGGRLLSASESAALARLDAELASFDAADIRSARDLIEALLGHGIKLEQERF